MELKREIRDNTYKNGRVPNDCMVVRVNDDARDGTFGAYVRGELMLLRKEPSSKDFHRIINTTTFQTIQNKTIKQGQFVVMPKPNLLPDDLFDL